MTLLDKAWRTYTYNRAYTHGRNGQAVSVYRTWEERFKAGDSARVSSWKALYDHDLLEVAEILHPDDEFPTIVLPSKPLGLESKG